VHICSTPPSSQAQHASHNSIKTQNHQIMAGTLPKTNAQKPHSSSAPQELSEWYTQPYHKHKATTTALLPPKKMHSGQNPCLKHTETSWDRTYMTKSVLVLMLPATPAHYSCVRMQVESHHSEQKQQRKAHVTDACRIV
jgi:hypothetical protein